MGRRLQAIALGIGGVLLGAALLFVALNLALFGTSWYRAFLDPSSSVGSFEATVARFTELPADRNRDVLVLGDSRLYSGLDPRAAGKAAGKLRFFNAAVPGTTPRCWTFLVRAIDPRADRFRAVIIPVDTYADDDSAIGSVDGDNRSFDLRFIVFQLGPRDVLRVARSFGNAATRVRVALDLLLRGPELRDDVRAFVADPAGRIRLLEGARSAPRPDPLTAHLRTESLAGLQVDFSRDAIVYPARIAAPERADIATQVLKAAQPSQSYAKYRGEWLGSIVDRYRATNTTVIFVRIPTRPAHRELDPDVSGSIRGFGERDGARIIPQAPYLALERPELFADQDHLNASGAVRFSRRLGRDVLAALTAHPAQTRSPAPGAAAVAHATKPTAFAATPRFIWPERGGLLFQSYEFFVFFVLVSAAFYAVPLRLGRVILLIASYGFYASWNRWYVVFLLALTASDYAIARIVDRTEAPRARKSLLGLGVAANLAFLGVLKYTNFATGTAATLFGLGDDPWIVHLIVPIGISFHTFQSISYLVDVYRKKLPAERNPIDYALYIAFFPQLMAGPIVRAARFLGELHAWRAPTYDAALRGVHEIVVGLVKKTVLADQFASVSDAYFGAIGAHPGAPDAWSGALAFALQIYFDFSGYSDIAIGCARLLGFPFPDNFRRPYLAWSITDFWRRWHISLSTWLRDYLYIPLGGNRHGRLATYRNLMLTMLLGGLWHGANWTFAAWGAYHGLLLSLERAFGIARPASAPPTGMLRVGATIATFALVCIGWVLFRAQSFGAAATVLRAMFAGGPGEWLLAPWMLTFAAIAFAFEATYEREAGIVWARVPRVAQAGALAALLFVVELLSVPAEATPFVYFKF